MELYEANHNAKQALTTRAFRWAALSDVGRIRTVNEDAHHVEPEIGLFLISDGMGGHRGGHMASRIVTEDLPVMIENKLHALRSSMTVSSIVSPYLWLIWAHPVIPGFRQWRWR